MLTRRLAIQFAPPLIAEAIAVAATASVGPVALRLVLQGLAVACGIGMAWRAGVLSDEVGTRVAASSVPGITHDRRRPAFDPGTGMCSSWYFRLRVEEEMHRTKRYEQPFTILTATSKSKRSFEACRAAMKKHLRNVDIASDLGDKLVVMMPSTDRAGAGLAIERLQALTKSIYFHAAQYPADGDTLSSLMGENEWQITAPAA